MTTTPITLVTGADHPTGLGGARALFNVGAKVIGLTKNPMAITCQSKVWGKVYDISGSDWLSALNTVGSKLDQPVFLLPTQDHLVSIISRHRVQLANIYKFVLPGDEIVQTFLDKTRFYNWARPMGLPLPKTGIANNQTDLLYILNEFNYPVILKPFLRTDSWNQASPIEKAYKLTSASDINRIPFDLFSICPSYIISEWIEGPDDAVHFCLAYCGIPGEITASFTGRKLLQHPRQCGSTAVCVGNKNNELTEITREVFRRANFQGLGSLEIKYDNNGKAYITEPTVGRPNLQSYSAVASGINLQAIAMEFALGKNSRHKYHFTRNCWWVEESAMLDLALAYKKEEPIPWLLLLKELLRARRISGAYWHLKDPAILLKMVSYRLSSGIRNRVRRIEFDGTFKMNFRK
jgi:D-aspartate ligase